MHPSTSKFVNELHDICSLIQARLDGYNISDDEIIYAFSAQRKRERHGYFFMIESDVLSIFGKCEYPNLIAVETEIGSLLVGESEKFEHVLKRLKAYIEWLDGIENLVLSEKLYVKKICRIEYEGKEIFVNEVERIASGETIFLEEKCSGNYFADCRISIGFGDYSAIHMLSETEKRMYLNGTLNFEEFYENVKSNYKLKWNR